MKYLLTIYLLLFLYGCGPSSIKLNTRIDDKAYSMFGKTPDRNFYLPVEIKDSLDEKWEAEVNGNFNNSSVAASDSFIFINDLSGRITCFRMDNGKRVGQLKNNGSVFSSPVIHKFLVIYADAYNTEDRSDLIFYDINTGKISNKAEVPGRVLTQLIKMEDGIILVTENGIVMKYNFLGHKVWENKTFGVVHSSPVLADDKILFGNDGGEIIAVQEETGDLLYRKQFASSFFGSASVSGGLIYIGSDNGNLLALDPDMGTVKWEFESGARIIANPAADDNFIVAGNLNGDIFKLEKNTGRVVWKHSTGGIINAAPFLTMNRIIVPDLSGKIYFINYESGDIMKTFSFPARMRLSPLILGNNLYIGFDKGILKCYEIFY